MDDTVSGLGALLILAIFAAVLGVGGLLITSNAVLYSENDKSSLGQTFFECTYFTGLRSVTTYSQNMTGCQRFIPVGKAQ